MFKNFWYVCDFSEAITERPRKLRLLGQDLVAYRGGDGRVVVMSDRCPHRGGSLSMAQAPEADGCLRCPYHGWKYDAQGACVEIPANGSRKRPPRRARIESYPVEERYGMVWVFLGDLPVGRRPPLPMFPAWDQPGLRAVHGIFDWEANYERVLENGVDISHTAWVHARSFGNPDRPEVPHYDVRMTPWTLQASTSIMGPEPSPLQRMFRPAVKSSPVTATIGVQMSCVSTLTLEMKNGFTMHLFDVNVPIDERRTRTFWISLRSFFTSEWADPIARGRVLHIFREDQPFVEAQTPQGIPDEIGAELHVPSDRMSIAYRQLRNAAIERGFRVTAPEPTSARARPDVVRGPRLVEGASQVSVPSSQVGRLPVELDAAE